MAAGFTWSINSQQNQITPWSNDPTSDPSGEAIYLRDEDTGEIWTPTSLPIREKSTSYSRSPWTRLQHVHSYLSRHRS